MVEDGMAHDRGGTKTRFCAREAVRSREAEHLGKRRVCVCEQVHGDVATPVCGACGCPPTPGCCSPDFQFRESQMLLGVLMVLPTTYLEFTEQEVGLCSPYRQPCL